MREEQKARKEAVMYEADALICSRFPAERNEDDLRTPPKRRISNALLCVHIKAMQQRGQNRK